MKIKLVLAALLIGAAFWTVSVNVAYRSGYRSGIRDESACWVIERSSPEDRARGQIRAHRAFGKRLDLRSPQVVNSVPALHPPPWQ
jgi:hypothetical protein